MKNKRTVYIDGAKKELTSTSRPDPPGDRIPHGTVMEDSSGNGHHGTYFSVAPEVETSQSIDGLVEGDRAATFDEGAYGFIPEPILNWTSPYTIEYWFRVGPLGSAAILWASTSDPPDEFNTTVVLHVDHNSVQLQNMPTAVRYNATLPLGFFDADPHHLVVTAMPGKVYLDGVGLPTGSAGQPLEPSPEYIYLSPGNFGSAMDEVALYPYALSAAQVAAHYAAASTSFEAYTASILADGPTAYYHLNEGGIIDRTSSVNASEGTKILRRKVKIIEAEPKTIHSTGIPYIPYLP